MFPLAELAIFVGLGCSFVIGLIGLIEGGEEKREHARKKDAILSRTSPLNSAAVKKQAMVAFKAKPVVEPKSAALVAAEKFAEPTRSEFAMPIAKQVAALRIDGKTFSNVKEAPLIAATTKIRDSATKVLEDYSSMPVLGAERRLPLKRIVQSATDVLRLYCEYRDWCSGSGADLDILVVSNVVEEFEAASESIAALSVDNKKATLNNLAVELHVLRDVTRR